MLDQGGYYPGHQHTHDNFQSAFFMPQMFDNNAVEQWAAEGSVEITARALAQAKRLLSEYQDSKLEVSVDEALKEYIASREREIPEADELNQTY